MRLPRLPNAIYAALVVVLALTPSSLCQAQSEIGGSIAGEVRGPGGDGIAGARVQVENTDSGERTSTVSDTVGRFHLEALPPGAYRLFVSSPGLSDWEADNLIVGLGSAIRLDAALSPVSLHRTVLVDAARVSDRPYRSVEAESGGKSILEDLPNDSRSWSSLAGLLGAASPGADGELSYRGLSPLLNGITVDGLSSKSAFRARERGASAGGFTLTQSSVGEFQAVGSGSGAQIGGHAPGGAVYAVTRNGSSRMRGRAVFYDRGSFGQAFNAFNRVMTPAPADSSARPALYLNGQPIIYTQQPFHAPDRRQSWEISAGGPIRTGRAWWFFSWGEHLRSDPAVARANEPEVFFAAPSASTLTTLQARLAGSTSPIVKACPAWSGIEGATATAACAWSSVLSQLDTMLGDVPRSSHQTNAFPKLTWRLNDRNTLVLQYNRMRRLAPHGVLQGASENYGVGSFGNSSTTDDVFRVQWENFATPSLVNSMRFQFSRDLLAHAPAEASAFEKQFTGNPWGLSPEISIDRSRGFSFGTLSTVNKRRYPEELREQFRDAATWIHGRRALRFGYDYDHVSDTIEGLNGETGSYSYASLLDFISDMLSPDSCSGTGTGKGSYPCYQHYRQTVGYTNWNFRTADYAAYLAGEWKMRPNLTLSLGVRYEYTRLPDTNSALVNDAVPETARLPHEKTNFGPRAGFAWDLFGRGTTVLRGGFGLYYGRVPNATVFSALTTTGSARSPRTYMWRPMDIAAPAFPWVFGSNQTPYVDPTAPDQRSSAPEIVYFDPHFRQPQIDQMELSLEQALGRKTVLTFTGMATNGHHLTQFTDANIDRTAVARMFYTLQAPGNQGDTGPLAKASAAVPGFTNLVYAPQRFYYRRTNSQYGAITDIISGTNSSYRGAMVRVVRRMSGAAMVNAGYTWAHAIDDNQHAATFADRDDVFDPAAMQLEHGTSDYDLRQRVSGGIVLRTPWRLRGAAESLLGGYALSLAGDWRTGLPYSMRTAGSVPTPSCSYVSWLNAGGATGGGERCLESVTDPNGVILGTSVPIPALGSTLNGSGGEDLIPGVGRNTFRYPVSANLDARLTKRIRISDRYSCDLMAEAFNSLNHRNVTYIQTAGYRIGNDAAHANMGSLTWQSGMKPATRTVLVDGTTRTEYAFDPTAAFGGVTNANSTATLREREIQLGLRLNF